MNEPPLIQTTELGRKFGPKTALSDVGFALEPGRIVALLGENGAGKSTLLNLIAGCFAPTFGMSALLGEDVREIDRPSLACMIDGHLPPDWTTVQMLVDLQEEASPAFDRQRALALLNDRSLNLSERFGSLSKGQKRWALVALTLASNARAILMDEPADGLDTGSRRALYDALRDAVNDGETSAVVATHIIEDIDRVADDVAIMRRGKLVLHEDLEELREQIREVELPADARFKEAEGIDLLGSRTVGGVQLFTVKCPGGDREIESRMSGALSISPVRLEDLYLKLTAPDANKAQNGSTKS
jgi:ABC-2 type transport system ATP-binding protein